ncbi:MAG: hypothetical protein IJ640_10370 [Prevotella sp.]|nr:hypothetical protein [Prevotella sp.]
MKTILKYELKAQSNVVQDVTMPKGYKILSVENLLPTICIFAEIELGDEDFDIAKFIMYEERQMLRGQLEYIGTVRTLDNRWFHVYQKLD